MPIAKPKIRTCRGCGKIEHDLSRNLVNKYCSKECYVKYGAGQHLKTGKLLKCNNCNSEFYARGAYLTRGKKFCSRACYLLTPNFTNLVRVCLTCQKQLTSRRRKQMFCCYRCSKLGNLNPNWKDNSTGRPRGWAALRIWREEVFLRDNYTCRICGSYGNYLEPHHLDGFHWCGERRFDITNGVTLCVPCHKKFHSIYTTFYNTEDQWIAFKSQALIAATDPVNSLKRTAA